MSDEDEIRLKVWEGYIVIILMLVLIAFVFLYDRGKICHNKGHVLKEYIHTGYSNAVD